MISVEEYVLKILKKKGWTLTKFTNEINKVREKAGITKKTRKQNVNNYLRDDNSPIGYRTLVVWEKALGLKDDTLCTMVKQPTKISSKRKLEELKKRVRNI